MCVFKEVFHYCYIKTVWVKIDKIKVKKFRIKIKGCVLNNFWFGRGTNHIAGGLQETQSDISNGFNFCLVLMKVSLLLNYGTIIFDYGMVLLVVKRKVK